LDKMLIHSNRSEDVDSELLARLLQNSKDLVPELLDENGHFQIVSSQVGRRPARKGGARVEVEEVKGTNGEPIFVIHAYGHGGAG
jgi:D-amino-acid oxidase